MAKKNLPGHFCKVCGMRKSNESFSGKGHEAHICKTCSCLTPAQQAEQMTLRRAWKGYDFAILNELTDEGLVNAGERSKSASFTDEGRKAWELLKQYGIALEQHGGEITAGEDSGSGADR